MSNKKLFTIVGIWFSLSLAISLLHDGFNSGAATRFLILGYFLLSLLWFNKKGRHIEAKNPKRIFITWCVINAMVVEVFHMISKPLNESLLVTSSTPFPEALKNTLIDLILTFPAYVFIFSVVWYLIIRYKYSIFSFFFLMALGQALGDGNAFFLANPGLILLVPYVMLNYWAMNFVPFLVVRDNIPSGSLVDSKFKKFILPVILLPVTYLIAGGTIITIGRALHWIP